MLPSTSIHTMPSVLDQPVLMLNSLWQPCMERTVRESVVFLASESGGEPPGFALDIEMQDGELIYANPVEWSEWVLLRVRPQDSAIRTAHGAIRAPTVIVAKRFSKMPMRRIRWSTGNVHKRDGFICSYTGEKLTKSTMTVDHILPRSRGGTDSWLNTTSCHKKINGMKGDRTPEEAGLTLLRKPTVPAPLPASVTIREARHETWKPFLVV